MGLADMLFYTFQLFVSVDYFTNLPTNIICASPTRDLLIRQTLKVMEMKPG